MQGSSDSLYRHLQRYFASVFQNHAIERDCQQRLGRSFAAGLGFGYMADDFAVSRNHNLTVRQQIGRSPDLDPVVRFAFPGVQRL